MWGDLEAGRLPQPDLTNLDAYLDIAVEVDHEAVEVGAIADYRGWWRQRLEARHRLRALAVDGRVFGPQG
jgi:hypothetical protein